jgi:predicted RNA-binding Zn-ribbon protein involved in translation (DUF1610 family)
MEPPISVTRSITAKFESCERSGHDTEGSEVFECPKCGDNFCAECLAEADMRASWYAAKCPACGHVHCEKVGVIAAGEEKDESGDED